MQTTGFQAGATDVSVLLKAFTTATGAVKTDITHATSGLELRYKRGIGGTVTTITAATQTANGAHSDGGIVHLHGGVYRVDVPDAAFVSGEPWVVITATVADTTFSSTTVDITSGDPRVAPPVLNVVGGVVEANMVQINDVVLQGAGTTVDSFRPV